MPNHDYRNPFLATFLKVAKIEENRLPKRCKAKLNLESKNVKVKGFYG
jgi:hypothetical protein